MASDRAAVIRAAKRYGASLDHIAKRYVNPVTGKPLSGAALLVKVVSGESSFDRNSVSPVGARGLAQFMPSSRAEAIRRFGVDPWRSPDEAVHAAALHLRGKINGSTGLEGYNPGGGQSYVNYILQQRVGPVGGSPSRSAGGASKGSAAAGTPSSTPSLADRLSSLVTVPGQGVELSQAPVIQASPLAPPAFSAKAVTPQGFQTPAGTSVQPPQELQLPDPTPQEVPRAAAQATASNVKAAPAPALPDGSTGSALAAEATRRANIIDAKRLPYKWGGGHSGKVSPRTTGPLDCSGAVSAVLGIDPRVSGQFTTWGRPGDGGSKGVTIYANAEHVLMKINGRFFGTSKTNPGGGAGWIPASAISKSYLRRFTVRHSNR